MGDTVQNYIDSISAEHRPLFSRIDGIVRAAFPDVTVELAYGMPVFRVGEHSLNVGVWSHGISIYGGETVGSEEFRRRYPALKTSRGTIRIRPKDAIDITDNDLRDLVCAALAD